MNPTTVLVHGAWADGSNWRKVLARLEGKGLESIAAQLPLSSLSDDVASLQRTIDHIDGEIILVGHSYAGAVISAAGNDPKVRGLVYITAYAPEGGETVGALRSRVAPHADAPALKPDAKGYIWMGKEGVDRALAHDLKDRKDLHLIWATQKPIHLSCLTEPMGTPAWKTKTSWFLACENDRMASIETQSWMAARMKSRTTRIACGHMPLLTHPDAVAALILDAQKSTQQQIDR